MSDADLALVPRMLVAHQAGIEPDGFAEEQGIGVLFDAVAQGQFANGGQHRFRVEPVTVAIAFVSDDDLVREDGAQPVEVDRHREVPWVDDPGIHIEVDEHAHHLLLEAEESASLEVLDSPNSCMVGGDALEDVPWISFPAPCDPGKVFLPHSADLVSVESETDVPEFRGEIFYGEALRRLRQKDMRFAGVQLREGPDRGMALNASPHPVAGGEKEQRVFARSPHEGWRQVLLPLGRYRLRMVERRHSMKVRIEQSGEDQSCFCMVNLDHGMRPFLLDY